MTILEIAQYRLFLLKRNGHVVFHGIESAQNQVEQCDGHEQLGMQLHDDSRKTATRQVEEVEASLEVRGVLVFVALVDGVVPDLPTQCQCEIFS